MSFTGQKLFLKIFLIKICKTELKTQKLQFPTATSGWRLNVSALGVPTSNQVTLACYTLALSGLW